MVGPAVPPDVAKFIATHFASLEQVELLLLLMLAPDRWWDAAAVSAELGIDVEAARHALDHLASRNLLAIRVTAEVRYQYQPGTDDLRDMARKFGDTYRTHRLAVLQLVTRPERRSIHDFAEAFRIRRDDDR